MFGDIEGYRAFFLCIIYFNMKKEIKVYSHDYTLPYDAEYLLYQAYHICKDTEARELIAEAREKLQIYLAYDNLIEDDDCAGGFIKLEDLREL